MQQEQSVPIEVFKKVYNLNKLIIESGHTSSENELVFFILNQTAEYTPYDRAFLFEVAKKTKILGVSGSAHTKFNSEILDTTKKTASSVINPHKTQIITDDSVRKSKEWKKVSNNHAKTSVIWCPIIKNDTLIAVLWLERWEKAKWSEQDVNLLKSLCTGYGVSWNQFIQKKQTFIKKLFSKKASLLAGAAIAASLVLIELPLRIIAECEVVPKDPIVITAPLDGVIDKVNVQPGQEVNKGDLLFKYDSKVQVEELNVQKQQIKVIKSDLERTRATAFTTPESKHLIALLETRLKQEIIKLQLAEYRASQLTTTAQKSGVVMIKDPNEWTGYPVRIGQKILQIIDPSKSKIKIWLPQDDKVTFSEKRPTKIILNTKSADNLFATLVYQAQHAEPSPTGISSFLAEAEWNTATNTLQMGLKGTAVIYGEKVPLWYWLFRRPLAYIRSTIGY